MKKNTLSKIAGGVATLALAATLTACGGGNANQAACDSFKDVLKANGVESFDNASGQELGQDPTKLKAVGDKMVEIGKGSGDVAKDFATVGDLFSQLGAVVADVKADPAKATESAAKITELSTKMNGDEFKKATENIDKACKLK
ncbi:hypothetical protein DWB68_07890 [Galactobacter valiniphilus]|uniref:Uncharacterized protein n=1 Tax=Galactobacter valiniphilus TaxID=2676122 RepID=A0A399JCN0_9MICC|nr:AvrE-family type 3 secretion system effector [Galactobacter valiniphilus]RII42307.1 hypothetical protein DWB68_07890 [Galactobacter valiniphilus]